MTYAQRIDLTIRAAWLERCFRSRLPDLAALMARCRDVLGSSESAG